MIGTASMTLTTGTSLSTRASSDYAARILVSTLTASATMARVMCHKKRVISIIVRNNDCGWGCECGCRCGGEGEDGSWPRHRTRGGLVGWLILRWHHESCLL